MINKSSLNITSAILNLLALLIFVLSLATVEDVAIKRQLSVIAWTFLLVSIGTRITSIAVYSKDNTKYHISHRDGSYSLFTPLYFKRDFKIKNIFYSKGEEFTTDICDLEGYLDLQKSGVLTTKGKKR